MAGLDDRELGYYLEELFARVAHDIRNPLQGLLAASAALSCYVEPGSSSSTFVGMIQNEAARIGRVVDRLMLMSLPVVAQEKLPVQNLILAAIGRMREDAAAERVSIHLDQIPEAHVCVRVDREAMIQAICLLIHKMMETPDPGKTVHIYMSCVSDGVEVILRTSDEEQEGASGDEACAGRGGAGRNLLDLPIIERIIRMHNGNVTIEDQRKGRLIRLVLPPYEQQES
jgi:nitrogen-specific signal transduction histidine kinase